MQAEGGGRVRAVAAGTGREAECCPATPREGEGLAVLSVMCF